MNPPDIRSTVAWLIDGARSAVEADQVLAELCVRLRAGEVPLWRAAVFIRTLHPQIMGRGFHWREGAGVRVGQASYDLFATEEFRGSPVAHVYASGQKLRRRLADPDCPLDFAILKGMRDEGASDYLVSPLIFTDGAIHVATWTTRQPGGFTPAQIAAIDAIVAPLARVAEIRAMRRTASNLLDTYVGNHAGERILAGHVRRGDTQAIDAAIWVSDMRRSTALAETLPPAAFIDVLNRFFDCQVPAIVSHGGEVLKFIGDGLLAIFPIGRDGADSGAVCRQALTAARLAQAAVAGHFVSPAEGDADAPRLGLALHIGSVLFGNIGSGDRLDFTCIGPAVNLAARIERLTGELGHAILASREFAQYCGGELVALGDFRLAGFAAEQTIFRLAE